MHFAFMHLLDMQSGFLSHGLPGGHDGAHAGAAQTLAVQTPEAQSESSSQGLPSGHFPGPLAHPGGWHVPFGPHCCELQSPLPPQALPSEQVGEHDGAAHLASTQLCEAQSESAPQGLFSGHLAGPFAHPGGWQVLFGPHCCEPHSPFDVQGEPFAQPDVHAGGPVSTPTSAALSGSSPVSGLASMPASLAASMPASTATVASPTSGASRGESTPTSAPGSPPASEEASTRPSSPTMSEQPVRSSMAQEVVRKRQRHEAEFGATSGAQARRGPWPSGLQ